MPVTPGAGLALRPSGGTLTAHATVAGRTAGSTREPPFRGAPHHPTAPHTGPPTPSSTGGPRWYPVDHGLPAASRWNGYPANLSNPPAVEGAAIATDPNSTRGSMTLLFGGAGGAGTPENRTWVYWSNQTVGPGYWVEYTDPRDAPPALVNASMDFDRNVGLFVLFGGVGSSGAVSGATWLFDPTTFSWSNDSANACRLACPASRQSAAMAFDPDPNGPLTVLFGGCDAGCRHARNDTWYLRSAPPYGPHWTLGATGAAPSPRFGSATAAVPLGVLGEALVLFGGAASSIASAPRNDTWEFLGGGWTNLTSTGPLNGSPPAVVGASMTYDWADSQAVLVGGLTSPGNLSNQTWLLSCTGAGCRWTNWTSVAGGLTVAFAALTPDTWGAEPLLIGGRVRPDGSTSNASYVLQRTTALQLSLSSLTPETGQAVTLDASVLGGSNLSGRGDHAFSAWWYGPAGENPAVLFGGWPNDSTLRFPTPGTWFVNATAFDFYDVAFTAGFELHVVQPAAVANASVATTDVGFPVRFSSALTGRSADTGVAYAWDFGDGQNASVPAPVHSYAVAGSFTATVAITDSVGGVGRGAVPITVHHGPQVFASVDAASVDPGVPVHFSAIASSGTPPYTYAWEFGDGSPNGSAANVTHAYRAGGEPPIRLEVTDAVGGRANASLVLIVNPPLTAWAGSNAISVSLGTEIAFNASAAGGTDTYSYTWLFGDRSGDSGTHVRHTYAQAGNYVASVWVNDTLGASIRVELTVHVSPPSPLAIAGPWPWVFLMVVGLVTIAYATGRLRWIQRQRRRPPSPGARPPGKDAWMGLATTDPAPTAGQSQGSGVTPGRGSNGSETPST